MKARIGQYARWTLSCVCILAIAASTAVLWINSNNASWKKKISGEEHVSFICRDPELKESLVDRSLYLLVCVDSEENEFSADLMVPNGNPTRLVILFAGYESRTHPEMFLGQSLEGSIASTAILFIRYLDKTESPPTLMQSLKQMILEREQLFMLPIAARSLAVQAQKLLRIDRRQSFFVGCSVGSLFAYAAAVDTHSAGIVSCLGITRLDRLVENALLHEIPSNVIRRVLGKITKKIFSPLVPEEWFSTNGKIPLLALGLRGDYLINEDEYDVLCAHHTDCTIKYFDGTHRTFLLRNDLQRMLFREASLWMDERDK